MSHERIENRLRNKALEFNANGRDAVRRVLLLAWLQYKTARVRCAARRRVLFKSVSI